MWYHANSLSVPSLPQWQAGDVVGCFLDIDHQTLIFSLNGVPLPSSSEVFKNAK